MELHFKWEEYEKLHSLSVLFNYQKSPFSFSIFLFYYFLFLNSPSGLRHSSYYWLYLEYRDSDSERPIFFWVSHWPVNNDDKNECVTNIFQGPVLWLRGVYSLMRQQLYFGDDLERGVWTLPELSIMPAVGGVWVTGDKTLTGMNQWRGAGMHVHKQTREHNDENVDLNNSSE